MFETDVNKIKEHETIQALLAASPDVAKGLYKEGYNSEYKYSRLTTRSNIDINLTEDFKVSVNLAYRFGSQNRPYGYDSDGIGHGSHQLRNIDDAGRYVGQPLPRSDAFGYG